MQRPGIANTKSVYYYYHKSSRLVTTVFSSFLWTSPALETQVREPQRSRHILIVKGPWPGMLGLIYKYSSYLKLPGPMTVSPTFWGAAALAGVLFCGT